MSISNENSEIKTQKDNIISGELYFNTDRDDLCVRTKNNEEKSTFDMFLNQIGDRIVQVTPDEENIDHKIFGLRLCLTESYPIDACQYTDDAYGMEPIALFKNGDKTTNKSSYNKPIDRGSWDDKMIQKLFGCRPCVVRPNGNGNGKPKVIGYLDPDDYTKWINGEKYTDATVLTNNNDSIMIEFDPIYYSITIQGIYMYIKFCKKPQHISGASSGKSQWSLHPAFNISKNKSSNHLYVSAYPLKSVLNSDGNNYAISKHSQDANDSNLSYDNAFQSVINLNKLTEQPVTGAYQLLDYKVFNFLYLIQALVFRSFNIAVNGLGFTLNGYDSPNGLFADKINGNTKIFGIYRLFNPRFGNYWIAGFKSGYLNPNTYYRDSSNNATWNLSNIDIALYPPYNQASSYTEYTLDANNTSYIFYNETEAKYYYKSKPVELTTHDENNNIYIPKVSNFNTEMIHVLYLGLFFKKIELWTGEENFQYNAINQGDNGIIDEVFFTPMIINTSVVTRNAQSLFYCHI